MTDNEYRILVVEDDAPLASMVSDFLTPHGFQVTIEGRGDDAVGRIVEDAPDAVVLDVNLPGLDGFSVCKAVRGLFKGPILILTARGEEVDEVVGLEVGADDYMSKPVRPRALLARLRMHLKRLPTPSATTAPIHVGTLVIDPARRYAELDEVEIELTTAEFDLLQLLAENAGSVLSRNDIYKQIHGVRYDGTDRSIDLRISRLRRKLGDSPDRPERIKSIRGVGYLMPLDP